MPVIARTPAQVVAGEMTYSSPEASWQDALNIASVIANRALALGVTQQQVIGVQKEFNAYSKALPAGADVDLAQAAIDNVAQYGPTTIATFYAMPEAVKHLPATRQFETAVEGGHEYYSEPTERGIRTTLGTRLPTNIDTVRAAAAQRQMYEKSLVSGVDMPTPEDRPQTIQMTQNPALMAAAPVSAPQDDLYSAPATMATMLEAPDPAVATQMQAAQNLMQSAIQPGEFAALEPSMQQPADIASFAAAMQAQRQLSNVPSPEGSDVAAAMDRLNNPAPTLSAEASANDRIAEGAAPKTDRLPGAAQALQSVVADPDVDMNRFGTPMAPAHAFGNIAMMGIPEGFADTLAAQPVEAQRVSTTSITPGAVAAASEPANLGNFPAGMMAQRQIAQPAAEKTSRLAGIAPTVDPARLDSPALSTSATALQDAMVNSERAKQVQALDSVTALGEVATTPGLDASGAIQSLISAAPAISPAVTGINSPEHQKIASQAEANLANVQEASDAANALGNPLTMERTTLPAPAVKTPTVESWSEMAKVAPVTAVDPNAPVAATEAEVSAPAATPAQTMSPEQISGYREMAQRAFEAGLTNLSGMTRINKYGELKSNIPPEAKVAALAPDVATPAEIQNTMVEYGKIPVPTPSPLSTPTLSEEVTDQPAPALETITVADTPTIAPAVEDTAVTPSVTPSVTPAASSSPLSASQALGTAMGVWGGQITTGTATDGSTVSRLDDGRVARYSPKYDHTEFTADEGKTWTGLVEGNKIPGQQTTKTLSSPSISASPSAAKTMGNSIANGSMAGSVIGALGLGALLGLPGAVIGGLVGNKIGGTQLGDGVPDQGPLGALMGLLSGSPTGVASRGTDGGMRTGTHGPAGTPSGSGPGGTGSSAGGYGTTGGHDPDGTR